MSTKNELSRLTIDIPKVLHKRLKTRAALSGKSMRDMVLDALEASDICQYSDHHPNKETLEAIENVEKGKNLTEYESLDDLFKKLGI